MDMFENLKELDTFGGLNVFRLKTNNFAVLAEETIDDTHIEQHRPQSCTIGDAIDIAVQRSHAERQNPKKTSKDKRSTRETRNQREQKNKGKGTIRVEMPELLNT